MSTESVVLSNHLKFMSTESVVLSNHLILCHPLLLLPSIVPNIKIFWNESALLIRWPKCWSFSFNIIPSSEYSGLISFSTDCLISFKSKGNQSNWIQEISPEYSLEGLMLKLKLQHFGHLMQWTDTLEKTLMLEKTEGRRRRGQQRIRWLDGITNSMDMS